MLIAFYLIKKMVWMKASEGVCCKDVVFKDEKGSPRCRVLCVNLEDGEGLTCDVTNSIVEKDA